MSSQPPQPPQWPQSPQQEQGWQPPQGSQPPAWGQTGYQPPPSKPKPPIYRRPWFIILGCLVPLGIVGALLGDPPAEEPTGAQPEATHAPQSVATQAPATEPVPEAPGIGNPVRDGKFEFTVRKIECGKSRIGDANFGTTAQGQFCFVYLKVENIGKEAQLLDGSNQYMFGGGGQRYDADSEAAIYLDDAQTFLEEINPGNSVNGIVVFDIPKSAKPDRLELHDSAFSGGVEVKV